jgi:hypothetical protein
VTILPEKLPNSLHDLAAVDGAEAVNTLLEKLQDMEKQRIAKDDAAIIRKGVLALLGLVGGLEARVRALESRSGI